MRYVFFFSAFLISFIAVIGASIRTQVTIPVMLVVALFSLILMSTTLIVNLIFGVSFTDIVVLRGNLTPSTPASFGLSLGLMLGCALILPFSSKKE